MTNNDNIAISVRNLSKAFKIYKKPSDLLMEMVGMPRYADYWALKDVSFDVKRGEVVGIIGRNGAGKSTLLRILAGTLNRTSGDININGTISAILELGTGFHPEHSGIENIYLGGMCMGMSKQEIQRKIDSIIEFSELQDVIDQPFKNYSSGMRARLTFAVAISVEPDVFIIDEALAAGDQFFVSKCMRRIEEICNSGATVLFVSHNLAAVERFCKNAVYIKNGRIESQGSAHEICKQYELESLVQDQQALQSYCDKTANKTSTQTSGGLSVQTTYEKQIGTGEVKILNFDIIDAEGRNTNVMSVGKSYNFRITLQSSIAIQSSALFLQFICDDARIAFSTHSYAHLNDNGIETSQKLPLRPGINTVEFKVSKLFLGAGRYFISTGIAPHRNTNSYDEYYDVKWKRWAVSVQREGLTQTVIFEQPFSSIEVK